MPEPQPVSVRRRSAARFVLITGACVGVLDGLAAMVLTLTRSGRSPVIVFQYIASALLGSRAFTGGATSAALGVVCHIIISLIWAALFFRLHPFISTHVRGTAIRAILYGLIIWIVMNLVVVPLTLAEQGAFSIARAVTGAVVLMLAAGLPIAYRHDRFYAERS